MKNLFIALLMLCSLSAFSKEYTEVVEVKGKNADQLYSDARQWFAETFNSANDVLKMDDPIAGKLIGKGRGAFAVQKGMVSIPLDFEFTLKVLVKDGRYKYQVENIAVVSEMNRTPISEYEAALEKYKNKQKKAKYFNDILSAINKDIDNMIVSLKDKMKGTEDDW